MSFFIKSILLVAVLLGSVAAGAEEPTWENLGLVGTEIHTVRYLLSDLFVGAEDGLHIASLDDGSWRDMNREGVAGWPVTAVGRAPFYPEYVITGRVDSEGLGALAKTYLADGATELQLSLQPGPFSRISDTGYFANYRVWACSPGGAQAGVVLKSGSGGALWTEMTDHGFNSPTSFAHTLAVVNGEIVSQIFLAGDGGVQSTVDNGATFSPDFPGLPAAMVHDVLVGELCFGVPGKVQDQCYWYFAASDSGLYLKTDDETAWIRGLADPCTKVRFISATDVRWVLVLTADRRLLSCDLSEGLNWQWTDWGSDLGAVEIVDFSIWGMRRAVATANSGVFEKVWPNPASDVPASFTHLQLRAVPNPFNPTTSLKFSAPRGGFAHLAVYDLRGQRVATLLANEIEAGPVSLTWQPGDLASGVYLARLEFNGVIATQRVVLIR
ncbi:MAG: T9SS type A sorting domain-containing protein [Candidatus Krumholzibacteria bacterium]|nr:T9SS type A sorting domain-containing protein [Candidatus Krumholzibacteria bacterium]